jgi:hypothetical protein
LGVFLVEKTFDQATQRYYEKILKKVHCCFRKDFW